MDVFDVATALTGDERELWTVWRLSSDRGLWESTAEKARAAGRVDQVAVAERALARLPAATALQGLQANAQLVKLLTGRRSIEMQRAREQGASWREIGDALGMSKQGAQDWYKRTIADQEYVGEFHDAARARAVLTENAEVAGEHRTVPDTRPGTADPAKRPR